MKLIERELRIPRLTGANHKQLLAYLTIAANTKLNDGEIPIRFVITETDSRCYHCELDVIVGAKPFQVPETSAIFDYRQRKTENTDKFTAVFLVPTGIHAEIGGHAGDAGPVARLLASSCDRLITHPNTVNASDIMELPDNGLYVEGSVITRLLMGTVGLVPQRSNRVMLVVDEHVDHICHEAAINAANAARASMGIDCPKVVVMSDKINMRSEYTKSGRAAGIVDHFERLCEVLTEHRADYDAVALSSVIEVPEHMHVDYYKEDLVNPWGGVEAMLTHAVSMIFNVPSAHSPMVDSKATENLDVGVVDPRKAAEVVSTTFLHCILKGLHRSPRLMCEPALEYATKGVITAADVSCLIVPVGCLGLPTLAALEQGIPVIEVEENRNLMKNRLEDLPFKPGKLFRVRSYTEASGVMRALQFGVAPEAVRRPLEKTTVTKGV